MRTKLHDSAQRGSHKTLIIIIIIESECQQINSGTHGLSEPLLSFAPEVGSSNLAQQQGMVASAEGRVKGIGQGRGEKSRSIEEAHALRQGGEEERRRSTSHPRSRARTLPHFATAGPVRMQAPLLIVNAKKIVLPLLLGHESMQLV